MARKLKVSDAVSRKFCVIEEGKSVKEAAEKMAKNKVRELLVVSGDEIVGIIVDADITRRVIAKGIEPRKTKIKDVMTKDLFTATEDDDLEEVARAMAKKNISRVPVVENDRLIGILTYRDILKVFPAYIGLLEEESHYEEETGESPREIRKSEGICDSCGNYSENLFEFNSEFLCRECLENKRSY